MSIQEIIKIFGERKIRSAWDDEQEEWYFSIVDVVAVLTGSQNPATYWKVLKNRLKAEGNQTVTNCNRLKMTAADGKKRLTDVATAEELFRVIQSIPSPKAEPFKVWMAQVAAERLPWAAGTRPVKTDTPALLPLLAQMRSPLRTSERTSLYLIQFIA